MRVITNRKETQCATCGKALYGKSTTHPDLRGVAVQEHDGGEWRAYCPEHAPKARKCTMCGVINAAPGRHHNTNCGGWTKRDAGAQEWIWPIRNSPASHEQGQTLGELIKDRNAIVVQSETVDSNPLFSETFGAHNFLVIAHKADETMHLKPGVVYRLEVSEEPPPDPEAIYFPQFCFADTELPLEERDRKILLQEETEPHQLIDITDICATYKLSATFSQVIGKNAREVVGLVNPDGSYTLNGERFNSKGIRE